MCCPVSRSLVSDLNPAKHLWKELKQAIWKRQPVNLRHLDQFADVEWNRIPAERSRLLTDSYRNRLIASIYSATKFEVEGTTILAQACFMFVYFKVILVKHG